MNIKTKYNIGDRVWIVYETSYYEQSKRERILSGEVGIYDTTIDSITIDKDEFFYCCEDGNYTELKEDEVILYEETDKLITKIKNLMNEINEREKKANAK